mmetsp:Transcript_44697/g.117181  ORF Transcript_44697/g.117181 Transcript_44697/m.117181 type:complete len:276 (-) Transcript_44697:644-1471(-)
MSNLLSSNLSQMTRRHDSSCCNLLWRTQVLGARRVCALTLRDAIGCRRRWSPRGEGTHLVGRHSARRRSCEHGSAARRRRHGGCIDRRQCGYGSGRGAPVGILLGGHETGVRWRGRGHISWERTAAATPPEKRFCRGWILLLADDLMSQLALYLCRWHRGLLRPLACRWRRLLRGRRRAGGRRRRCGLRLRRVHEASQCAPKMLRSFGLQMGLLQHVKTRILEQSRHGCVHLLPFKKPDHKLARSRLKALIAQRSNESTDKILACSVVLEHPQRE